MLLFSPFCRAPESEWGPLPRPARQFFARVRTTLFVEFQKALAPAMLDGNRNPEGLELESAVRQGAGLYPRCCADQKRKRKRADKEPVWRGVKMIKPSVPHS